MHRRILAAVAAGLAVAAPLSAQAPAPPAAHAGPGSYTFIPPNPASCPAPPAVATGLLAGRCEDGGTTTWATAEYLLWYTRDQRTPRLVASIPDQFIQLGGTVPEGAPITNLYPRDGRRIEFDVQNGVRAQVGASWGPLYGFDVGGFVLETKQENGFFASPGSPSLARNYVRAGSGTNQFLYSALPGQYGGQINVFADTQVWGLEGNARVEWYRMLADRNELLAGFRYVSLSESLVIDDRSDLPGGVVNTALDVFRTRNMFYGGQIGLHTRFFNPRGISLDLINKLALGGTYQRVEIFGANTLNALPPQSTGLYAQPGNSGVFERGRFGVVAESTVNLGYCITPNVRVHVGYNVLWQNNVVRPGLAIDRVLNDSNIRFVANPPADTTNARPVFNFNRADDDFVVQGLNLGLTILY